MSMPAAPVIDRTQPALRTPARGSFSFGRREKADCAPMPATAATASTAIAARLQRRVSSPCSPAPPVRRSAIDCSDSCSRLATAWLDANESPVIKLDRRLRAA